ncbi:hypothetical protein J3R30DRAFT_221363 [Lentinula aciculospora]|uniref:Uncharacterized protein n=1 Tax=Lentinula aciculospora TaxID=153920 RepID=A0A9W9DMM4_9AGAR|nr:hypothetical protein J3R30DRAFT_221363 [Lentinula aciculospora]
MSPLKLKRKFSGASENFRKEKRILAASQSSAKDSDPGIGVTLAQFVNLIEISPNTASNIQNCFGKVAKEILHHWLLVLRSSNEIIATFEVLELEFYLWIVGVHEDPFTHGSAEQARSGNWYFHRTPQRSINHSAQSPTTVAGGYRGGTRKGLDITIGPSPAMSSPYFPNAPAIETSSTRGGILLRTLRNASTGRVISGPSLVVDEILKLCHANSISELVEKQWMCDISAFREQKCPPAGDSMLHLMLKGDSAIQGAHIYQSPRIGLGLSHPSVSPSFEDPRVAFLPKPYRYFVHPELLVSNGRPQTFLGALFSLKTTIPYPLLYLSQHKTKNLVDNVCKISGVKAHTAAKYLRYYLDGHNQSDLRPFVGRASKDSPSEYLELMGILTNAPSAINVSEACV